MSRSAIGLAQLDGRKWQQSHQATVDSILGAGKRKVVSRGTAFFNKDNWTARGFAVAFCEWARLNPDHCPDQYDLEGILRKANAPSVGEYDKGITIASTPDDLPRWLAWALVGGGYHEAWHTRYSRTSPILMREVSAPIAKLWGLVPFDPANGRRGWAGLAGAVLTWSNIIEDIIIERRGCIEFPGSPMKMEALQDLILQQEGAGTLGDKSHRAVQGANDVRVVIGAFRDLGLGYQTPDQMLALANYKKASPKSWDFVTKGPLKPLLDRSIALGAAKGTNGLESLWLAMEVVATIWMATTPPPPPPAPPKGASPPPPTGAKPQPPKQQEASPPMGEEEPEPSDEEEKEPPKKPKSKEPKIKLILYKVGDRAKLTVGEYAGRTVEIVRAGLPDEKTGEQDLEYALVEEEI